MLSITSSTPDPLQQAVPRCQYRAAVPMLPALAVFLYAAQLRTNGAMTLFCGAEFAVMLFLFSRLAKQRTTERANQFTRSWLVVSALTLLVHNLFFLH